MPKLKHTTIYDFTKGPSQPASHNNHLQFVDGLRALAAIYVVLHHIFLQVWTPMYAHYPTGWVLGLTSWLNYGHFAVALFIVLSGYCLMLPVIWGEGNLRGGPMRFFLRRARRILPPYYFAMALSLLLILLLIGHKTGTHWDGSLPVTVSGLIFRLLLLQDVFGGDGQINHVFWSIAVEWHIYFLFPLLVWSWSRFGAIPTTSVAILLGNIGYGRVSYPAPQFLGLFAMGMFSAHLAFSDKPRWQIVRDCVSWVPAAIVSTFLLIFFVHRWGGGGYRLQIKDNLVGLITLCILVSASRAKPHLFHAVLSWKPLVFIGGFSYSLYLIHAPLIQVVWQYALLPMHLHSLPAFLLLILLGLPFILGTSYIFYLWCERPFMNSSQTPSKKVIGGPMVGVTGSGIELKDYSEVADVPPGPVTPLV